MSTELEQKLNQLMSELQRGDHGRIASRLKVSRGTVINALNGKKGRQDEEIIQCALKLVEERQAQDKQLAESIEKALTSKETVSQS